MRILRGYSKGVQKDFESLKNTDYPMYRIYRNKFDQLPGLERLVLVNRDETKDKQLLQDIADYINDKAEFADPKYYVRFTTDSVRSYLNMSKHDNHLFIDDRGYTDGFQTQFTMDEIKELGDKYVPFAVPVSEVND